MIEDILFVAETLVVGSLTLIGTVDVFGHIIANWGSKKRKVSVTSFDIIRTGKHKIDESAYNNVDMIGFDDIAGLTELKKELKQFLSVFNDKELFIQNSVEIPRGLLLYGPPGCGKTSLAKAIAKEAGVNFLCRNASDLISGTLGGNKIAQLFKYARKHSPCVIFIDELDIIGSRYSSMGAAGAHQIEVTRLLAEMDGFQKNSDILVIGATNDISKLDSALLRSGRFSKKFFVGKPASYKDILSVINMYRGSKPIADSLSDKTLVRILSDLSPADIKSVLNESAIYAVTQGVNIDEKLLNNVILELNLKTNLVSAKNNGVVGLARKLIAIHEAGHAIVGKAIGFEIVQVTLQGTQTGAGGLTHVQMNINKAGDEVLVNSGFTTIGSLIKNIILSYGGVSSELIHSSNLLDISSGCDKDMQQAYAISAYICNSYTVDFQNIVGVRGLDYESDKQYVLNLLKICQDIAKDIILQNKEVCDKLADALAEDETIYKDKFDTICEGVSSYELDINKLINDMKAGDI